MKIFKTILFAIFLQINLFAQESLNDSVKYTPGFKFSEGFYLNYEQVKTNSPVPKSRIISTEDYSDPEFFDKVLDDKKVYYYDNLGNRNELSSDKIWGYSRNGALFIKMQDGFYRITQVGTICHFVAVQTTYTSVYGSPYYYNSYYDPYMTGANTYPNSEVRQFILYFPTGKVLEYSVESIEILLMNDPELHDEFMQLKKKKKKQSLFLYLRKFNERNPLYFPKI